MAGRKLNNIKTNKKSLIRHGRMNILMAAAECTPFAKVGGLADVVGSLPKELSPNTNVEIVFPLYQHISVKQCNLKLQKKALTVYYDSLNHKVDIYVGTLPKSKVKIYFLKNKKYLSTGGVYIKGENDKNQQRFSFFSVAVLEFIKKLNTKPDILHLHDWHTGLLAKFIKDEKIPIKTVYTIHNLAMQGKWNKNKAEIKLANIKFKSTDFKKDNLNMLRLGILYTDIINTVSPTYAKEILTTKFSEGLKFELTTRREKLFGILNGLDTDHFNPATDKFIYKNFSKKNIKGKEVNKQKLQAELKLPIDADIPMLGAISRLYDQKGLDWVADATPTATKQGAQIVVLGTGDKVLENKFKLLQKKYPKNFRALIKFDLGLAQKIYASCDIFLVPSRFEPCGLTQMMAMRYGTIPIVRSTGGLKDTVTPFQKTKNKIKGSGFVFSQENYQALSAQIAKAIKMFHNKDNWLALQQNTMNENFSWQQSAKKYLKLYRELI